MSQLPHYDWKGVCSSAFEQTGEGHLVNLAAFSYRLIFAIHMALQFHRAIEHMEIWSASSDGFSFVISYESPNGPGFRGRAGYVASWRRAIGSSGAVKIGGSPFKMLAEAEEACSAILRHLTNEAAREVRYALPPTIVS